MREELPQLTEAAAPSSSGAALQLANIAGRAVAISSDAAWVLDAKREQWTRLQRREGEIVGAVMGDGQQAFVVSKDPGRQSSRVGRIGIESEALVVHPLPALPVALTEIVGAPRGDSLYVAGRDAAGALQLLQLSLTTPQGGWVMHPSSGDAGRPTSLAVQIGAVYLTLESEAPTASGVAPSVSASPAVVAPPEAATTRMLRWSERDGWRERAVAPGSVITGAARAIGQAHVLYLTRSPQGSTALMSYHTISDAWAELPYTRATAVSAAIPWGNGMLTASAAGGGVAFESAQLVSGKRLLSVIDWIIIVIYLGSMIGLGLYVYLHHRKGSAAEFFVGSRAIPFWAAGVSLYATNTSSISYVAIPAKAFETDWQYMMSKLVTVVGLMFVAVWIVPLLRRLDLVSVFNYLEMRFHASIRMLASALCMLMHVGGRMSVVLFLPALAIATITGVDVVVSILIMGVCTIVYTALGGMRAVVWTDFVQVIVLMGGAIFAIGFIIYSIGGEAVYATALAYDKTKLVNLSFDFTEPTVWGFLFLILLDTVLTFPKDQVLMQRTLATSSDRNAGRSIWIFAAVLLPGGLIFYGIGTVLFVYYKQHPERLDPLLPIDATFPLFIAAELPAGLTGLIIAGIFAAAMGTLSSTINSVATLLSVDFFEKLAKNPTQERSVRFAEWMSVVIGLIGIGLAILLSRFDIHSLLDLTIELAGLLGGGFAGAYTLGMFTRRANSEGVSIGVAAAILVTLVAWWNDLVHPYFYLGISIFVCIIVGYVSSLFFPPPTRSLAGLTIFKDV